MDPNTLLAAAGNVPLSALTPWITAAVTFATLALLVLPAPTTASSPMYLAIYGIVHRVAALRAPPAVADAAPAPARVPTAAAALMMAMLMPTLLLAACGTPAQQAAVQAQVQQFVTVACNVDGTVVPIADPVLVGLVPQSAPVISIDQALVHPAVVAVCKGYGGTPAMAAPPTVTPAK